jgi:hypothetical protein
MITGDLLPGKEEGRASNVCALYDTEISGYISSIERLM